MLISPQGLNHLSWLEYPSIRVFTALRHCFLWIFQLPVSITHHSSVIAQLPQICELNISGSPASCVTIQHRHPISVDPIPRNYHADINPI
jgi:hypothetical protein